MNSFFIHTDNCSRCLFSTISTFDGTFPHLQCFAVQECISTWPWIQSAHQPLQLCGTLCKIHQSHFFTDHCRIRRRAFFRLLRINCGSIHDRRNCTNQKFSAFLCKFVKQTSACFIFCQRNDCLRNHISRIQSDSHFHDRHSGFLFSIDHSLLDWCGSSVFRKKRRMDIQASVFRHIQDRLRNDLTKCCNYDHVRSKFF